MKMSNDPAKHKVLELNNTCVQSWTQVEFVEIFVSFTFNRNGFYSA